MSAWREEMGVSSVPYRPPPAKNGLLAAVAAVSGSHRPTQSSQTTRQGTVAVKALDAMKYTGDRRSCHCCALGQASATAREVLAPSPRLALAMALAPNKHTRRRFSRQDTDTMQCNLGTFHVRGCEWHENSPGRRLQHRPRQQLQKPQSSESLPLGHQNFGYATSATRGLPCGGTQACGG